MNEPLSTNKTFRYPLKYPRQKADKFSTGRDLLSIKSDGAQWGKTQTSRRIVFFFAKIPVFYRFLSLMTHNVSKGGQWLWRHLNMQIEIPEFCVAALIGVSSSGKSTFCKTHFKPTEVLSSDYFRALVSDDENNQEATQQAFEALNFVAHKRLELGKLTVIDATSVQQFARKQILRLAKDHDCFAAAIVLDLNEEIIRERNKKRNDRNLTEDVLTRQMNQLRKTSAEQLKQEGFRFVYVLSSEEEISNAQITRAPMWNNKKTETGPFDIIGDVHGCFDELCDLLKNLNYNVDTENFTAEHPEGRKAVFIGDLCDRGIKNIEVLRLVMNMEQSCSALCVLGNHDFKLLRQLRGNKVQLTHGLDITVNQLEKESEEFRNQVKTFLESLISHFVLDQGNLVIAHAGLKEEFHGRSSGQVRSFCLFGDTTGEKDENGFPVRLPWADNYKGKALVVYGHTPIAEVQSINNTVCIDTGCVFGGKLTAFRYPEKEIVQVKAKEEYYPAGKNFK